MKYLLKTPKVRLASIFAALAVIYFCPESPGEETNIEMTADKWQFAPGKVEFNTSEGTSVMKILPHAGQVVLKDFDFTNGTIEFDMRPDQPDFVSFYFRRQSAEENEIVYFRTWSAGKLATDTLQYAPTIKGVNLWDMLGHYQCGCWLRTNEWNHVKLIVSGAQMRVYVNNPQTPVLEIPQLEGTPWKGGLALDGSASFAHLKIRPNEVDGLPATKGIDPTHNDPRYLRRWAVSQPLPLPAGRELGNGDLPNATAAWEPIEAERRGLINLTRHFGKNESRRAVWLKVNVHANTEQKRRLELGFSDEVWVYVNGKLAYVDKNLYGQPVMKSPGGRCDIENASFNLPLKAGENELLIGVANDFYGWGIIARLDEINGIEIAEK